MTITFHKNSVITDAKGIHTTYNNKPVMCISTGEVFASVTDAAQYAGSSVGTMSCALRHNRPLKGKKYCFVARVTEHLDELMESAREREEKASAYNEMKTHKEKISVARDKYVKCKANVEELRRQLDEETKAMECAELELRALYEEL